MSESLLSNLPDLATEAWRDHLRLILLRALQLLPGFISPEPVLADTGLVTVEAVAGGRHLAARLTNRGDDVASQREAIGGVARVVD